MRGWLAAISACSLLHTSKESRVRRRLSLAPTRKLDGFRACMEPNQIDRAVKDFRVIAGFNRALGWSRENAGKTCGFLPE